MRIGLTGIMYMFLCLLLTFQIRISSCRNVPVTPAVLMNSPTFISEMKETLIWCRLPIVTQIWNYKSNNVIKTCDQRTPFNDTTNLEYSANFDFPVYLCTALFDISHEVCTLPKNITDSDVNLLTPDMILKKVPPATEYCDKIHDVLITKVAVNDTTLWMKVFRNNIMNKEKCESVCVSDKIVNPLCAYIYWLNKFVRLNENMTGEGAHHDSLEGSHSAVQQDDKKYHKHDQISLQSNQLNSEGGSQNKAIETSKTVPKTTSLKKEASQTATNGVAVDQKSEVPSIGAGAPQNVKVDGSLSNLVISAQQFVSNTPEGKVIAMSGTYQSKEPAEDNSAQSEAYQPVSYGTGVDEDLPSLRSAVTNEAGKESPSVQDTSNASPGKLENGHSLTSSKTKIDVTVPHGKDREPGKEEKPIKPVVEKPAEPEREALKPAEPEREAVKPAEPEREAVKPAEPEREGEKPAVPEREGEKPAEPEREGEKPAEPEREGEKPAEPEREGEKPAEPERQGEKPAELEGEGEKPAELEDEGEKPSEPPGESLGEDSKSPVAETPNAATGKGEPQELDQEVSTDDIDQDEGIAGTNLDNIDTGNAEHSEDDYGTGLNEGLVVSQVSQSAAGGKLPEDENNIYTRDRFVEAEDSHFFAYFMTMIVLCIIGYLVFHNKQKILALALEGRSRRGTRRRPNTAGYRKLDSNLEEAVTSTCSTSVTHVIY